MRLTASLGFTYLFTLCLARPHIERIHPDYNLNVLELVQKHGYPLERHIVETEDGYVLEIHRIPGNQATGNRTTGKPVLVMHGLSSSSADWVNTGPGKALAYLLHDQGYDVWLGNARGTRWGRQHRQFDPDVDKKEFWSFSWHEIGKYDLPAMIDYVLPKSGAEKLHYVGHSQGTTAYFVMASERPEYNDKVKMMAALAPVAYMKNSENPFGQIASKFEESIEWIAKNIGLYEFMPSSELYPIIGKDACDDGARLQELCSEIIFLICGYDSQQLNASFIPVILSNFPSGSSTKQYLHYAQGIKNGGFRQYDYHSEEENMAKYGQATPPDYDIAKMTSPIALYYGQNDLLTSVKDVEMLRDELPNVIVDNKIAYKAFNHLDFLWATDVVELLYNDLLTDMAKYN